MTQPPDDVTICALAPEDLDGLTALLNLPGFRFGTARLPFTPRAVVEARINSSDPNQFQLVAEHAGAIVGSASLFRGNGRRAHVGVVGMGVHDDHVGRGIGTALLQALLDLADNWLDLRRLELTVYVDNDRAIRLYERAGFATEGRLADHAFRDGAYVDAFAMARLRR